MAFGSVVLVGALVGLLACGDSGQASKSIQERVNPAQTLSEAFADATAFREQTLAYAVGLQGYIYGYPPVDYGALMKSLTTKGLRDPDEYAPLFQIKRYGKLLGPGEGFSNRAPNNDSIYFYSWLDLRAGPVLVETPAVRDRYHVLTFADFFSEVQHTGRRTTGDDAQSIWVVGPDWSGEVPPGIHLIQMSTHQAFFLGRMLAVGGPEGADVKKAAALIDQYEITPLHSLEGLPTLDLPDFEDLESVAFFEALNRFLRVNPRRPGEDALMAQFDQVGFGPSKTFDAKNLSEAARCGLQQAITDARRMIKQNGMNDEKGWFGIDRPMGEFGFQYLERAALMYSGLLGNQKAEAVYPRIFADTKGQPLVGTKTYTLLLPGNDLPPVDGFWSLTAYDARTIDFFPNDINRYAIGDRTPGLKRRSDGSIEITISEKRPNDPSTNWLPVGDGRFFMVFRMYLPREEVLSGDYKVPEPMLAR